MDSKRIDLRVDDETLRLVTELGQRLGLNHSAAVRYAIRRTALHEGIELQTGLLEGLEFRPGPKNRARSQPPEAQP